MANISLEGMRAAIMAATNHVMATVVIQTANNRLTLPLVHVAIRLATMEATNQVMAMAVRMTACYRLMLRLVLVAIKVVSINRKVM